MAAASRGAREGRGQKKTLDHGKACMGSLHVTAPFGKVVGSCIKEFRDGIYLHDWQSKKTGFSVIFSERFFFLESRFFFFFLSDL